MFGQRIQLQGAKGRKSPMRWAQVLPSDTTRSKCSRRGALASHFLCVVAHRELFLSGSGWLVCCFLHTAQLLYSCQCVWLNLQSEIKWNFNYCFSLKAPKPSAIAVLYVIFGLFALSVWVCEWFQKCWASLHAPMADARECFTWHSREGGTWIHTSATSAFIFLGKISLPPLSLHFPPFSLWYYI